MSWEAWPVILLLGPPCVARMADVYHGAQPLFEMGSHEFFILFWPGLASNLCPPDLYLPSF
jgi:hypothetical protein